MDALEAARASVDSLFDEMADALAEADYSVKREVYGAAMRTGLEVIAVAPAAIGYTAENSEELEALIAQAPTDPIAYDALSIVAADMIQRGKSLPQPLAQWASSALTGEVRRPQKKVGKNQMRDFVICLAVEAAVKAGLYRLRHHAGGGSASDVVAECLKKHGIQAGYDAVRKIWERDHQ